MLGRLAFLVLATSGLSLSAQQAAVGLPQVVIYSPRVANQQPVGTFAMPVSVLRFEPRVDVQARNLAEGQADIAIRGGTFETTGIHLGALPLYDPQTGHYLAEIPVAPAMIGAPDVLTGAKNSIRGWNATAGTVAYGWRPIKAAGAFVVGGGEFGSYRGEFYQGWSRAAKSGTRGLGADVALASSGSNGTLPFGESRFSRANGRIQLAGDKEQTDLVYGYQEKFFGWPNLYTPFNSNETENLQTALLALNHRAETSDGGFVEFGAYWRRNKDDYAFNRFAPLGPIHPFQHTTRVLGTALNGNVVRDGFSIGYKAGIVHDDLQSSSLTFGRYHDRTFITAGVFPEKRWKLSTGRVWVVTTGASFDRVNRGSSTVSPVLTIAREESGLDAPWSRLYFSYAKTTQEPTYTALNSSPTAGLFRGNPDLGRSTGHNIELGASGAWAGWQTSAALFFRRDGNLVDWTFRNGVTARTANAVDIDTTGFEFFAQRSLGQFDVAVGYTFLAKDANYGSAAVDASFYALNFPKHRLTAALTARLGAAWEVRLDNDVRLQSDNLLRMVGGDRAFLSTLGVYFHPVSIPKVTISLQVGNVWDSEFQAVPAVPATRRQAVGSIAYAW